MSDDNVMLTIPLPRPTQNVHRGYNVKVPKTKPTTVRFNDEDRKNIDMVAMRLNMSFGEFVRWCSYYASIEAKNYLVSRNYSDIAKPTHDADGYE